MVLAVGRGLARDLARFGNVIGQVIDVHGVAAAIDAFSGS
jgi:hypothetical protein